MFRDTDGRLGVLDEYCPHRRASLALGRNEECGLRCLYHGWKMDVDGNVVEMPSEPPESGLAHKVKHKAYPVPRGRRLRLGLYGSGGRRCPSSSRRRLRRRRTPTSAIVKIHVGCNWAQVLEGQIDSAHSSSLHSTDMVPARGRRRQGDRHRLAAAVDRQGAAHAGASAPASASATWRSAGRSRTPTRTTTCASRVYVAPFTALIPPNNAYNVATRASCRRTTSTPCSISSPGATAQAGVDQTRWRKFNGAQAGRRSRSHDFRNMRTRDNNYRAGPRGR